MNPHVLSDNRVSKWDFLQKCRKITYLLFAIVSGLRSREWESASQTPPRWFEFCKPNLDFEHRRTGRRGPSTSVRASGNNLGHLDEVQLPRRRGSPTRTGHCGIFKNISTMRRRMKYENYSVDFGRSGSDRFHHCTANPGPARTLAARYGDECLTTVVVSSWFLCRNDLLSSPHDLSEDRRDRIYLRC